MFGYRWCVYVVRTRRGYFIITSSLFFLCVHDRVVSRWLKLKSGILHDNILNFLYMGKFTLNCASLSHFPNVFYVCVVDGSSKISCRFLLFLFVLLFIVYFFFSMKGLYWFIVCTVAMKIILYMVTVKKVFRMCMTYCCCIWDVYAYARINMNEIILFHIFHDV